MLGCRLAAAPQPSLGTLTYHQVRSTGVARVIYGIEAKLSVVLSNGASGVLTVTCELGSPPAGHMEGVTLILGPGGEFTMADGGNTVSIHQ